MIVVSLLCRTWLRCHFGRDSNSCCPASSNVSSAVGKKDEKKQVGKHTPLINTTEEQFFLLFQEENTNACVQLWRMSFPQHTGWALPFRPGSSDGFWGYQSYQVVPACIMNHPALLHQSRAPPLGVFDGLDHPHQRDVAASRRARRMKRTFIDDYHNSLRLDDILIHLQAVYVATEVCFSFYPVSGRSFLRGILHRKWCVLCLQQW